jgi:hypothetical protein
MVQSFVLLYSHSLYCFEHERHICLPYPPNCYLPKSGRHVTSLDQGLSSSEARSGKSLGTRLCGLLVRPPL